MAPSPLSDKQLVRIAKALADPTRLQIYEAIVRSPRLCCGDVGRRFAVAQATVSHHLRILVEAGLVETAREGQFVHVRPLSATLSMYRDAVGRLVEAASAACEPETGIASSDEDVVSARSPTEAASPAARRAMRRGVAADSPPARRGSAC